MSDTFKENRCATAALPGQVECAVYTTASVVSVRAMARDTWAVRLNVPEIASRITPGQFFMVRPTSGSDPLLGRPFALYDVCHDESGAAVCVEFGFVRVGKLTSLMSQWRAEDSVQIWGPLGNGFPVPKCRRLICVAGGIGQTPFLAVARETLGHRRYGTPARTLAGRPDVVSLCYGARSVEYLAGLSDFDIPGLTVHAATDDGSYGHRGYVTDLLQSELGQHTGSSDSGGNDTWVYSCGPEPMMKAVAEICAKYGVPCWLSLETPMACGIGACFSCVAKVREPDGSWDYRRTCVEGPVFEAEQLVL